MGDGFWAGIPPWYVTKPTRSTQPCIPLGSLNWVPALIVWGKGGNVTSAGWQVTLCDPIWHVSSRSGEAWCELLYLVTYLLTYMVCWTHLTDYNNPSQINPQRRMEKSGTVVDKTHTLLNNITIVYTKQYTAQWNAKGTYSVINKYCLSKLVNIG